MFVKNWLPLLIVKQWLVYMTSDSGSGSGGKMNNKKPPHNEHPFIQQILEDIKIKYNISEEMYNLILLILSYYDSILENINRTEIIKFIERFIKNSNLVEDIKKLRNKT